MARHEVKTTEEALQLVKTAVQRNMNYPTRAGEAFMFLFDLLLAAKGVKGVSQKQFDEAVATLSDRLTVIEDKLQALGETEDLFGESDE